MPTIVPSSAPTRRVERPGWMEALVVFAVVTAVVWIAVWLGARAPLSTVPPADLAPYPGSWASGGWFRFDAGWYEQIATSGYSFAGPSSQSSVAFFPAYPVVLWALHAITGVSVKLLATLVTLGCGAGVAVLFRRWSDRRARPAVANAGLVTLLLYPYAFYLMGAAYADALFLVATLGAFVLLEGGHPVLAGLAGAVATAARPLGIAVVVGLVAVMLCERRALVRREGRPVFDRHALVPSDAGVLLSAAGLAGWLAYLGVRFADPLAFEQVQRAPGWDQGAGPRTWFKVTWFQQVKDLPRWVLQWLRRDGSGTFVKVHYAGTVLLQGLLLVVFLWLAWLVWRRLGWGYGVFSFALLAIPLTGTKDFQGSGRYLLAAFPCYFVVGEMLVDRPVIRRAVWAVSGIALLACAFSFGRGYYVA